MTEFKFKVGELVKLREGILPIFSPADPSTKYKDSLRVMFGFWDGKDNVYVVVAEDGIGLCLRECEAELQEAAADPVPAESVPGSGSGEAYAVCREDMLAFAEKMSFFLDDRLRPYDRTTLRSEAWLNGYEFGTRKRGGEVR